MIGYRSQEYKEFPLSIIVIATILSFIGLVVLNSISQGEYTGFSIDLKDIVMIYEK